VPILFGSAVVAVVLCTNWMMSVGPAVAAHVSAEIELLSTSKTTTVSTISSAAISSAATSSAAVILLVCL
jgi:hypothetical protein